MRIPSLLGLILTFFTLAGPRAAWAVNVTFCAEYQVDYQDSDMGLSDPAYEGDYFATNSNKTARGVLIRTVKQSNSQVQEYYADWTGGTAGCAGPFNLVGGAVYDVQIRGVAQVNGNTVIVYNNQDDQDLWYSVALASWTAPNVASNFNIQTANWHRAWNVAAAAGHALWRRNGGMVDKTYKFFTDYDDCNLPGETACDPCGGGDGSCHNDGEMYLSNSSAGTWGSMRRFVMIHEMGHAMQYFRMGDVAGNQDSSACRASASTGGHWMNSMEWQSTAIKESWAHFYAATAFNVSVELDCGFMYYKGQDYDWFGGQEAVKHHPFSCEEGPSYTTASVDAKDYLGDWCTTQPADRGTEMDWLRFWWDFMSEEATVDFNDCLDIFELATSGDSYFPDRNGWDPAPDSYTDNEDRPIIRMEQAAIDLALDTEFLAHEDNGNHR